MKLANSAVIRSAIERNVTAGDQRDALLGAVDVAEARLPDNWVYRIIVTALGFAIFVPLIALPNQAIVQMLLPISTAALGALAGLLAPAPGQS